MKTGYMKYWHAIVHNFYTHPVLNTIIIGTLVCWAVFELCYYLVHRKKEK